MFTAKEKVQIGEMKVQNDTINILMFLTSICNSENFTIQFFTLLSETND